MQEASPKWKFLGINLGLPEYNLPQEHDAVVKKSFMDMLSYSLNNPPEFPYKRSILYKAVKRVNPGIAMKLEKDYNNDEECEYNIYK